MNAPFYKCIRHSLLKEIANQIQPHIKDGLCICVIPGTGGVLSCHNQRGFCNESRNISRH